MKINSRPTAFDAITAMLINLEFALKGVHDLNNDFFVNKDEIEQEVEERIELVMLRLKEARDI